MGAVLLRAPVCLNCGGAMPSTTRIDRRYCKASCRTLAYRVRKRSGLPARPRTSVPRWVDGQPPTIASVLAALAELQARVLHIAHHVEQDDIAYRHACPAPREAQPSPSPETVVMLAQKDEQIRSLQHELREAREQAAEAARQAEQCQIEAAQQAQESLRRIGAEHAATQTEKDAEIERLQADLTELRRKALEAEKEFQLGLEQSEGAIRIGRSVEDKLRGELKQAQMQISEGRAYIRELKEHLDILENANRAAKMAQAVQSTKPAPSSSAQTSQAELTRLRAENAALSKKLTEASLRGEQRAQKWQDKADELQAQLQEQQERTQQAEEQVKELLPLAGQLGSAQRTIREQGQELRTQDRLQAKLLDEIEKLQPEVFERDPLTLLVREKFKAQHVLATTYQEATRRRVGSESALRAAIGLLPRWPNNVLPDWEEAITEATSLREGRLRSAGGWSGTGWVVPGQLLDPASEQSLCREVELLLSRIQQATNKLRQALDARR